MYETRNVHVNTNVENRARARFDFPARIRIRVVWFVDRALRVGAANLLGSKPIGRTISDTFTRYARTRRIIAVIARRATTTTTSRSCPSISRLLAISRTPLDAFGSNIRHLQTARAHRSWWIRRSLPPPNPLPVRVFVRASLALWCGVPYVVRFEWTSDPFLEARRSRSTDPLVDVAFAANGCSVLERARRLIKCVSMEDQTMDEFCGTKFWVSEVLRHQDLCSFAFFHPLSRFSLLSLIFLFPFAYLTLLVVAIIRSFRMTVTNSRFRERLSL